MISYCLVFADRNEAISTIGTLVSSPSMVILDIGDFSRPTGVMDKDGNPVTEVVPGYHVNVLSRVELPHVEPYRVNPDTPSYSWLT